MKIYVFQNMKKKNFQEKNILSDSRRKNNTFIGVILLSTFVK